MKESKMTKLKPKLKVKKPEVMVMDKICDHIGKLELTKITHLVLGTELISECVGCGKMWRH